MAHRFVSLRTDGSPIHLYEEDRKKKFREVIWGDYLKVKSNPGDGWLQIDWAARSPTKRRTLYIREEDTVVRRPLEIIFLDVGQGDGAVLISPETGSQERIVVIDAGEGGNMRAFLAARFQTYRGFDFAAAVMTHPDQDHYYGFKDVFADPGIGFGTVYHNGLVERPVAGTWEKLGGKPVKKAGSSLAYIGDLAVDHAAVKKIFANAGSNFLFPQVMKAALANPKIHDIRMLSVQHAAMEDDAAWMPDFAPSDKRGYTIQVLAPVVEEGPGGKPALRQLGSYNETKNGHSVILRLQYGKFSVLFGGDLNEGAEKFLLQHYTDTSPFPKTATPAYDDMVAKARDTFRSDVMKSCHHGSEKVTDAFLDAVNPAAFIISSGDEEGHVHSRPDLLGRLGRFGRGGAPVILSTELQRSSREREDPGAVGKLLASIDKLAAGTLAPAQAEQLKASVKADVQALARSNVEVYGAIYLKTDGERLMTAFRIETGSETKKWFSFRYRFEGDVLVRED
ncbi:ComEC/Rec2 family competence protein [Variovorax boronicumulans]|uniref:ComEC/Rec2 family competence protein n=1 Tax=Variovorax boronicumulans TaxID=436515 RepID=UPI003395BB8F